MKRWGSSRRLAVRLGVVALVLGLGVVPAAVASGSRAQVAGSVQALGATRLSGFSTAPGAVRVGGVLWSSAVVSPAGVRVVSVQYRRAGTARFVTAWTGRTSAAGRIPVWLRPPAAGRWQFRVVVAASSRLAAVASPLRTILASGRAAATGIAGFSATPARVSVGQSVLDDVVIVPRSVRLVDVQARRPGTASFVTVSSVRSSRSGTLRVAYRPSAPGTWNYRLVLPATATALGVVSRPRAVTAVDTTAPGPVTGLSVTGTTAATVSMSWTDPAAADFSGVMIRRATGGTPPATPSSGTAVTDTSRTATTFTDTGLQPATSYSYALFAHDGVGNNAAAATLTVTTGAPSPAGPSASLSVGRHFGSATTKLTAGADASFDASGSLATAGGATLVSATLDYGDGSAPDTFGAGDYWGTTHAYATAGAKTVTLTVTDSTGATAATSVKVTVLDAPSASSRVTSGPAHVGAPVTLALDASVPPGAGPTSYHLYVFGAETFTVTGAGAPPATQDITFTIPGTYTVSFCVDDDAGGSATATELVIQVS